MSANNHKNSSNISLKPLPKAKEKYTAFDSFDKLALKDREWPTKSLNKAPIWCSVDLRDGNQALIDPMGQESKMRFFNALVEMGFKEIEIGFPSASDTDFEFTRSLLKHSAFNFDAPQVWPQVLTQAREGLIAATLKSLEGFPQAIVHLYNSTSRLQREVVFKKDRQGIIDIAKNGAELVRKHSEKLSDTNVRWQYSPESFTGTEMDFALEICEAVMDIWEPTPDNPIILNLPSTVENSMPNVYADQIEWFCKNIKDRKSVIISIHPHNDRGTAIASAELALLAGADRVEGTLFGNGERTGNVDIITMALNLHSHGFDPELKLGDINKIRELSEHCTKIPVPQRHPYAGDLVFTAFSGSHQDAIKKGFASMEGKNKSEWSVPYLPIDPKDIGRDYEPIIRINSQSGKGGIAYIMKTEFNLELPRSLQVEFSKIIQKHSDKTGKEISSEVIWQSFNDEYLNFDKNKSDFLYQSHKVKSRDIDQKTTEVEFLVSVKGQNKVLEGKGNGPLAAFIAAINSLNNWNVGIVDYHQHALGHGEDAKSATYLEMSSSTSTVTGVGLHTDIAISSMLAVASGVNQLIKKGKL